MDANRFDTVARLFASRKTRRAALAGSAGLVAASLGGRVLAQAGTPSAAPAVDPDDPHPGADDAREDPEFLFVQPFKEGTWAPKDGDDGTYTLTLSGAAAQTIYFSDRPERIVGLAANQEFLDGLGFTPDNPPNAALVAVSDAGEQEVLVIELLNPAYDPDAGTLTYDARVLADYSEPALAHLAQQQTDYELAESFGEGGLFIDSCPDGNGYCYQVIDGQQQVGYMSSIGCCWKTVITGCTRCTRDETAAYYGQLCAAAYPDSCSAGESNGAYTWNCYVDDVTCPIA